jgi:hypothetical protein
MPNRHEDNMQTVKLGATGLVVTPLAYGTWQFGGDWGLVDEQAAIAAIGRARSLGINFFDTAQAYGFGRAERLLGAGTATGKAALTYILTATLQVDRGSARDARHAAGTRPVAVWLHLALRNRHTVSARRADPRSGCQAHRCWLSELRPEPALLR